MVRLYFGLNGRSLIGSFVFQLKSGSGSIGGQGLELAVSLMGKYFLCRRVNKVKTESKQMEMAMQKSVDHSGQRAGESNMVAVRYELPSQSVEKFSLIIAHQLPMSVYGLVGVTPLQVLIPPP